MSGTKKRLALALAATAVLAAPSAFATNGYFAHGFGTKNKGLAGSGVALPQDAMAAATNPAGMVFVGNRMDLGAAIFSPSPRSYEASAITGGLGANGGTSGTGTVESNSDYFLIPHFGRNWMLDSDTSLGLTIYGNGGMNTNYPNASTPFGLGTFGGSPAGVTGDTGVNLAQLFVNGTYAKKFSQTGSWGASAIFAYQRFRAYGLQNFTGLSNSPANVTNNGDDTSSGFGLKFGAQGEVGPGVTLAGSYQTEMSMDEFERYKGLFAEGGGFDIPATATIGLAFTPSPQSAITFDVQKIWYSKIDSIANPISNITRCPAFGGSDSSGCLGGANGAGFGWEDMTIYKLGYQWQTSADWSWRVGYSQGDQPIPNSELLFNILAPAVIEEHVTFGFTRNAGKNSELNFAAMYALNNSATGVNIYGAPSGQNLRLEMKQYELELSWAKKF